MIGTNNLWAAIVDSNMKSKVDGFVPVLDSRVGSGHVKRPSLKVTLHLHTDIRSTSFSASTD